MDFPCAPNPARAIPHCHALSFPPFDPNRAQAWSFSAFAPAPPPSPVLQASFLQDPDWADDGREPCSYPLLREGNVYSPGPRFNTMPTQGLRLPHEMGLDFRTSTKDNDQLPALRSGASVEKVKSLRLLDLALANVNEFARIQECRLNNNERRKNHHHIDNSSVLRLADPHSAVLLPGKQHPLGAWNHDHASNIRFGRVYDVDGPSGTSYVQPEFFELGTQYPERKESLSNQPSSFDEEPLPTIPPLRVRRKAPYTPRHPVTDGPWPKMPILNRCRVSPPSSCESTVTAMSRCSQPLAPYRADQRMSELLLQTVSVWESDDEDETDSITDGLKSYIQKTVLLGTFASRTGPKVVRGRTGRRAHLKKWWSKAMSCGDAERGEK